MQYTGNLRSRSFVAKICSITWLVKNIGQLEVTLLYDVSDRVPKMHVWHTFLKRLLSSQTPQFSPFFCRVPFHRICNRKQSPKLLLEGAISKTHNVERMLNSRQWQTDLHVPMDNSGGWRLSLSSFTWPPAEDTNKSLDATRLTLANTSRLDQSWFFAFLLTFNCTFGVRFLNFSWQKSTYKYSRELRVFKTRVTSYNYKKSSTFRNN